jgi:multidrug efflux pump subunit AcrB
MRVWIDPDQAAARGLTASDIVQAIREQNVQIAAGAVGQQPIGRSVDRSCRSTPRAAGHRRSLATSSSRPGRTARRRCSRAFARIELGSSGYSLRSLLNNQTAVAIPIFQSPGANALQLSTDVRRPWTS